MKRYECIVCGWIYDEALGCPEEGIAPTPSGKTSLKTGFVQSAVLASLILRCLRFSRRLSN